MVPRLALRYISLFNWTQRVYDFRPVRPLVCPSVCSTVFRRLAHFMHGVRIQSTHTIDRPRAFRKILIMPKIVEMVHFGAQDRFSVTSRVHCCFVLVTILKSFFCVFFHHSLFFLLFCLHNYHWLCNLPSREFH